MKNIIALGLALFLFTVSRDFGGVNVTDSNSGQTVKCSQTFSGYSCS